MQEMENGKICCCNNPFGAKSDFLNDYFLNSSIHGFRYFGEKRRHWTERIWWIIALLCSLFVCGALIRKVYTKWQESPVVVTFAGHLIPITNIQFPAVTICPEAKVRKDALNVPLLYENLFAGNSSFEESLRLISLALICPDITNEFQFYFLNLDVRDKYMRNITNDIEQVAPKIEDVIITCKWRDVQRNCSEIFTPRFTEEGLCFTFNGYNDTELYTTEITEDLLISSGTISEPYESKYSFDAGFIGGLEVMLMQNGNDLEYFCRRGVEGFKMILHAPDEMPQSSKYFLRLPVEHHISVALKPHVTTTTHGLLEYRVEHRQCLAEDEKSLRFFQTYSQRNCELECAANFSMKEFNCTKFGIPRPEGVNLCLLGNPIYSTNIWNKYREKYVMPTAHQHLPSVVEKRESIMADCGCLPKCITTIYDTEISQVTWNSTAYFDIAEQFEFESYERFKNQDKKSKISILSIFFKEEQYYGSQRSELYNQADFWASCGGIASLFMGISVLSLVEFVYHFTLRLCCRLRQRELEP